MTVVYHDQSFFLICLFLPAVKNESFGFSRMGPADNTPSGSRESPESKSRV